jgi:hypothetical protein
MHFFMRYILILDGKRTLKHLFVIFTCFTILDIFMTNGRSIVRLMCISIAIISLDIIFRNLSFQSAFDKLMEDKLNELMDNERKNRDDKIL